MIVYTYFDPSFEDFYSGLAIRFWEQSWRKAGWTPRLLTRRDLPSGKVGLSWLSSAILALTTVRGGLLSSPFLINVGFGPETKFVSRHFHTVAYSEGADSPVLLWVSESRVGRLSNKVRKTGRVFKNCLSPLSALNDSKEKLVNFWGQRDRLEVLSSFLQSAYGP